MDPTQVEDKLSDFMSRTFLFEFGKDAQRDTDLFEAGLIDSFGFIELVGFIEEAFAVTFSDDELASPDTSTLAGITGMVVARLGPEQRARIAQ